MYMSSSRSVAAARARRAGGSNNNNTNSTLRPPQVKPPIQYNQTQQQKSQQYVQKSQQYVQESPKTPYDTKLSVSDAFALVTIRLGRVETILQKMDVSNLIEKIESGETTSEEAGTNVMIKSLLSRIEDIENKPIVASGGGMTDEDRETISSLNDIVDDVKADVADLKNTLFKIQSMVIDLMSGTPKETKKSPKKLAKSVNKEIVNEVVEDNNIDVENTDESEVESVGENEQNEYINETEHTEKDEQQESVEQQKET